MNDETESVPPSPAGWHGQEALSQADLRIIGETFDSVLNGADTSFNENSPGFETSAYAPMS